METQGCGVGWGQGLFLDQKTQMCIIQNQRPVLCYRDCEQIIILLQPTNHRDSVVPRAGAGI